MRDGVTVDICRACRGIWLDRGELERLVSRERRSYQDDYDDYRRARAAMNTQSHHYPPYKRRKSWVESLGDLFD
jgi:Zn-finger nucleic acid-binding protein